MATMMEKELSMQEFNELIRRLTEGMPITIVLNRLTLALVAVLDEAGRPGIRALREFVEEKTKK